jgi:hypothetical protein
VVNQHWLAVRKFLAEGDEAVLAPFVGWEITDLDPDEYDGFRPEAYSLATGIDDVLDLVVGNELPNESTQSNDDRG